MKNGGYGKQFGFLERFGIGSQNSKKVYEKLGKDAVRKIEENPYILLELTYGVDFKKIDKMAMDLGIENNNEKRIISAIKYSLIISSYNGHTCVILDNLVKFVIDLLNISYDDIEEIIVNLNANKEIIIEEREYIQWVYLSSFYNCEKNIAKKLIELDGTKNIKKVENFEETLKKLEKKSDIELSEEQKRAIKTVNDNNVCIITRRATEQVKLQL